MTRNNGLEEMSNQNTASQERLPFTPASVQHRQSIDLLQNYLPLSHSKTAYEDRKHSRDGIMTQQKQERQR